MDKGGKKDGEKRRKYLAACAIAFLIYLAITLIMFWPISLNPTHTIVNGGFKNSDYFGGDVYQSLWDIWWTTYAIFHLHTSIYSTSMLFYPLGASLAVHSLAPLASILTAPFQPLGLVFRYNLVFIAGFALSGLFMFMLAYFFVKDKYAAFIAGLIYAFTPISIAQSYVHIVWASVGAVPLFILAILLAIERNDIKYAAVAGVAMLFLLFLGEPEIAMITTFFAAVLIIYLALTKNKRFKISLRSIMYVFLAYLFALAIGSPFFIPILKSIIFSHSLSAAKENVSLGSTLQYSNNLLSFFLPSYYNGIFNGISGLYYNQVFSFDVNEKVAYIGYTAIFLACIGILYGRKKKDYAEIKLWLFVALFFGFVSLGPLVQVAKSVLPIPGPYLLYYAIPVFNIALEPGKFDLFAMMGVAVLAAMGFHYLSERISKRRDNAKRIILLATIAFSILILIEYNGMPTRMMAKQLFEQPQISAAYNIIAQRHGNFSVLILPDLRDNYTNYLYVGMDMYYQSAFAKPIFGGVIAKTTAQETFSTYVLPLSLQSAELQDNITNLSDAYPIMENYTYADRFLAKTYNISFVAITRKAYGNSEFDMLNGYASSAFGSPVYASNATVLYSTGLVANYTFGHPVAYAQGPWELVNGTWWANESSEVVIYSKSASNANISIKGLTSAVSSYECLNGMEIGELDNSTYPYANLSVALDAGFNRLAISANSSCSAKEKIVWGSNRISLG